MAEMRTMEHEWLKVSVCDLGAELCSIYNKKKEKELIWTGDPKVWGRHAPVLFPFVGKVTDGFYTYQGKKYPMGQHGFARDMVFELVKADGQELVHRIVSNEKTKKNYPFDFILEITHKLEENRVTVGWKVVNSGTEEMFFSIGGHPGFNVNGTGEYLLSFDGQEELTRVAVNLKTGCAEADKPMAFPLEQGTYRMDAHTFDGDALIFDHGQVKKVGLVSADGKPYVTMYCPDARSVGIWSVPGANTPFICLEPWIGRCDNDGFQGELKDKFDVQRLLKGQCFTAAYVIEIGE